MDEWRKEYEKGCAVSADMLTPMEPEASAFFVVGSDNWAAEILKREDDRVSILLAEMERELDTLNKLSDEMFGITYKAKS